MDMETAQEVKVEAQEMMRCLKMLKEDKAGTETVEVITEDGKMMLTETMEMVEINRVMWYDCIFFDLGQFNEIHTLRLHNLICIALIDPFPWSCALGKPISVNKHSRTHCLSFKGLNHFFGATLPAISALILVLSNLYCPSKFFLF